MDEVRPIPFPPLPALCCLCGNELFEDDVEASYCEDCREGSGDLEDLLDAALAAADRAGRSAC